MSKGGRSSNGEGSIRKREDDRFECRVSVEDATGRKRRISFYGETRKEVVAKRDAVNVEAAAGTLAAPNRHTVETYLTAWLEEVQQELKGTTHQGYKYLVDTHIIPRLGQVQLTKLSPLHVEGMMAAMLKAGLSARTTAYARAVLRRSFQQALRWGLVGRNVATNTEPPRQIRQEMQAWTPAQAGTFLTAAEGHWLYALFYLALTTGMRRGELLGLRWQDVDEPQGKLHVRQALSVVANKPVFTEPKTTRSRRAIHVSPETFRTLRAHQQRQHQDRAKLGTWPDLDLIFTSHLGTPLGTSVLNLAWAAR